jgi:Integrase core domain
VEDAKRRIEAWRCEYNTERPHSSIYDLTPKEFAEQYKSFYDGKSQTPGCPAKWSTVT